VPATAATLYGRFVLPDDDDDDYDGDGDDDDDDDDDIAVDVGRRVCS